MLNKLLPLLLLLLPPTICSAQTEPDTLLNQIPAAKALRKELFNFLHEEVYTRLRLVLNTFSDSLSDADRVTLKQAQGIGTNAAHDRTAWKKSLDSIGQLSGKSDPAYKLLRTRIRGADSTLKALKMLLDDRGIHNLAHDPGTWLRSQMDTLSKWREVRMKALFESWTKQYGIAIGDSTIAWGWYTSSVFERLAEQDMPVDEDSFGLLWDGTVYSNSIEDYLVPIVRRQKRK